jgi:beta-glucosidase
MKKYFTLSRIVYLGAAVLLCLPLVKPRPKPNRAAKMNVFVNGLMKKMTVDEKIGQLNLVTGGWL